MFTTNRKWNCGFICTNGARKQSLIVRPRTPRLTGEGTYDRVTTGPGATMPTDAGTINHLWE
ncbi:MAG: hypothetical protein EXS16_03470 [Gemmataceae bacterium]|nr:hypothetical protein [Gemmataceae bacterium]